jgi:hypothetical protein
VPLIMRKFGLFILVGFLFACTTDYNDYYYGKENRRWFICGWDHHIVIKDLSDSLQIWNLDDECNSGYGSTEIINVVKKAGAFGQTKRFKKIQIKKISDKRIELELNSGGQIVEFSLSRQSSNQKAFRVINIIQMLKIDREMENYIHANSTKAKDNHEYLFQNYRADDKVEVLNPDDFSTYYREKQLMQAQAIVKKLGDD